MKKTKKTAAIAAAFLAAMNLNACAYGPEPAYDTPAVPDEPSSSITEAEEMETQTSEPVPEPEDYEIQAVYGPPVYSERQE